MTTHPHEEQLSAYMDGRLDVAQTHDVARHLSACASCQSALAGLQKTKALLRDLEAPAMPGLEFWTNAYRRLRVEGGAAAKARSPWETLRTGLHGTQRRWAAGLAVAGLVAAAVVTPWVSQGPPPPPPVVASDFVDVSSLVRAHAASAARQPLADPDRQTMIAADVDDFPEVNDAAREARANATSADAAP